MSAMTSQITGVLIVYSTVCSCADQRKHQSSASLAYVRGIHRWSMTSPHIRRITRKCFHLMALSWWICRRRSTIYSHSYVTILWHNRDCIYNVCILLILFFPTLSILRRTGDRWFDRYCRHRQLAVSPWWRCWRPGWRSFVFNIMYICLL